MDEVIHGGFWRESLLVDEIQRELSPWREVIGEVLDLCDDREALAAFTGKLLNPDQALMDAQQDVIRDHRLQNMVSCDPEGLRYAYITVDGPFPPGVSPEDAIKVYEEDLAFSPLFEEVSALPPGNRMGYYGPHYPVDSHADEVSVMHGTVTVIDGVIRGLVQNRSRDLWARDLVVSAGDNEWRYPLTVQPGELAPFEIEGWAGSSDPDDVDLQITASLSATVDVSRALRLEGAPGFWAGTWEEFLEIKPAFAIPDPPTGPFGYYEMSADLLVPTSHPELADQVMNQTIEDLRAYTVFRGDDDISVIDVIEPAIYEWYDPRFSDPNYEYDPYEEDLGIYIPVDRIPSKAGLGAISVGFKTRDAYDLTWIGGANNLNTP